MNETTITSTTFWLLLPETILVAEAVWIYVGGAFSRRRATWYQAALFGLLLAGGALWVQASTAGIFDRPTNGPLLIDPFAFAVRAFALVIGVLLVLTASRAAEEDLASDYLASLLLVLAGVMLVGLAGELVLLFVALELISIPTYLLIFLGRPNSASHEATTKYFFLSILSSAIFLYGLSFVYGLAGSTYLLEIRASLASLDPGDARMTLAPLALMLVMAGLAFKMAVVPFHFYAPDVYQGTTSGNAALLAVVPKIAAVVVLARLVVAALPGTDAIGWKVALAIAVVTMTLGNVLALWQRNIRRLLAYSSIAHAGYMFIGLAVALAVASGAASSERFDGLAAMYFYLVVYALATVGAFAALVYLGRGQREIDDVDELAGLGRTQPLIAAAMALNLFSLAGLPPLAGFLGKLTLFFAALDVHDVNEETSVRTWFVALAVIAAVNAAIAVAYYLRIVGVMYFRQAVNVPRAEGGKGAWLATVGAAVLVIVASAWGGRLIEHANRASRAIGDQPITQHNQPTPTNRATTQFARETR